MTLTAYSCECYRKLIKEQGSSAKCTTKYNTNKLEQTLIIFLPPRTSCCREGMCWEEVTSWQVPKKCCLYKGRLSTQLTFHPRPAPDFHEKLHLDFPESLPPTQKPVLSRNGKFSLPPVLQPLLDHTIKSSASYCLLPPFRWWILNT